MLQNIDAASESNIHVDFQSIVYSFKLEMNFWSSKKKIRITKVILRPKVLENNNEMSNRLNMKNDNGRSFGGKNPLLKEDAPLFGKKSDFSKIIKCKLVQLET